MRSAISELVSLSHGAEDIAGGMSWDWEDTGVIGWDDSSATYFLQVDMIWWFGKMHAEIQSLYIIIKLIKVLFDDYELEFNEDFIKLLIKTRNDSLLKEKNQCDIIEIVSRLEQMDIEYKEDMHYGKIH